MLEKYKKLLNKALENHKKTDHDGAVESCEYFDGQINILRRIIGELEMKESLAILEKNRELKLLKGILMSFVIILTFLIGIQQYFLIIQ